MSRKHTRRKVYQLVNPISHAIAGAAITDTASLDRLRLSELSALEAFARGTGSAQELAELVDMVNVAETMANNGIGPEALPIIAAAQVAFGEAIRRQRELGKLGFSGPELEVLRHCFEYHDLQRSSISRSRYEQELRKTIGRIRGTPESQWHHVLTD